MISKIFTWVRQAPATARIDNAAKAKRDSLRLVLFHANAEMVTTAMAQTAVTYGARSRTVKAKASCEGVCERKGRMTYIGTTRQMIGMSVPRIAIHKALCIFVSRTSLKE